MPHDRGSSLLVAIDNLLYLTEKGQCNRLKVYCEFNTSCPSRPKQLTWCAMGAVICYWDDYLDVVGPTMDTIRYPLINKIILYDDQTSFPTICEASYLTARTC
ncbi:unnamed protein product [Porites lobata]|uniref:Vps16 N-terminal domain-containing protein n=1 Tax=Porites lobata TaxID=104759 RepID=A0ABN8SBV8_9CNID|nr:unnamed protein product [Porites lobata]